MVHSTSFRIKHTYGKMKMRTERDSLDQSGGLGKAMLTYPKQIKSLNSTTDTGRTSKRGDIRRFEIFKKLVQKDKVTPPPKLSCSDKLSKVSSAATSKK